MKYEKGDKVVVEIEFVDKKDIYRPYLVGSRSGAWLSDDKILGKLEDFAKPEKIRFSEAEKKEFDELLGRHDNSNADLDDLLDAIWDYPETYSNLQKRLFRNAKVIIDRKKQFEFARALEKPSLIEVVREKKYWIKLADGYLVNVMGDWLTLKNKKDGDIFTQSEIDELQKREQFKAIDLNKCKEEAK